MVNDSLLYFGSLTGCLLTVGFYWCPDDGVFGKSCRFISFLILGVTVWLVSSAVFHRKYGELIEWADRQGVAKYELNERTGWVEYKVDNNSRVIQRADFWEEIQRVAK
jgi:hypothetical protein